VKMTYQIIYLFGGCEKLQRFGIPAIDLQPPKHAREPGDGTSSQMMKHGMHISSMRELLDHRRPVKNAEEFGF